MATNTDGAYHPPGPNPPAPTNPFAAAIGAVPMPTPAVAAEPPTGPPPPHSPPIPSNDTRPPDSQALQQTRPVDPQVAALHAMFPDFDELVLQSVLESVGGNQDRAIDMLLGMSDPSYKSEVRQEEPVYSQTDLDEQLARRLMLEEQEQEQQAWQAQHGQRTQRSSRRREAQPQTHQPGQGEGQEKDTMAEFQEQFSKIAETGKKTFGTIFSKVKAKIQEFDQPRQGQGSASGTQPSWGGNGGGGTNESYNTYQQQSPRVNQQQPYQPYQERQQHQQPSYYDPNPPASPPPRSISPPIELHGYDATPATMPAPPSHSPPPTLPQPTVPALTRNTPPPASDIPRPTSGQGVPIDGVKLGLLPKRPVSLMRPQSPPTNGNASAPPLQRRSSGDSSDGLEYAESPFEEPRK